MNSETNAPLINNLYSEYVDGVFVFWFDFLL